MAWWLQQGGGGAAPGRWSNCDLWVTHNAYKQYGLPWQCHWACKTHTHTHTHTHWGIHGGPQPMCACSAPVRSRSISAAGGGSARVLQHASWSGRPVRGSTLAPAAAACACPATGMRCARGRRRRRAAHAISPNLPRATHRLLRDVAHALPRPPSTSRRPARCSSCPRRCQPWTMAWHVLPAAEAAGALQGWQAARAATV
jgi:hypothetical protein